MRMHQRKVLAGLLFCLAFGGKVNAESSAREPWLRLETRGCLGVCPIYSLTVYRDGAFAFDGRRFVVRRGMKRGRLQATELTSLRKALVESGFLTLADHCCDCRERTDHPWSVIQVTQEGVSKKVEHYHGCSTAPRSVPVLEDAMVTATRALRWIGTYEERERRTKQWISESRR
jgi:hypothetical protein